MATTFALVGYERALGHTMGVPVDERSLRLGWDLGWVKTMAKLGYLLVDPLYPDGGTSEARAAARDLSLRAVQRAVDIRAAL